MARLRPAAEPPAGAMVMIDVRRAYRDLQLLVGDRWDESRWPSAHELSRMTFAEAIDVAMRACEAYQYGFPPWPPGGPQRRPISRPG